MSYPIETNPPIPKPSRAERSYAVTKGSYVLGHIYLPCGSEDCKYYFRPLKNIGHLYTASDLEGIAIQLRNANALLVYGE